MIDSNLRIHDSLCTGCSACTESCMVTDEQGVKPICLLINKNGLRVPRIDTNTCVSCMACYKACPVKDRIYGNDGSFETYKDRVGDCFYGYSLDDAHRFEAASAGIVTEIASYLLDSNQVDAVVSSYQNEENDVVTDIFTKGHEVRKTRGSIYRQVSLLNGLHDKLKVGHFRKLLVIGLPCHIAGLRKLQTVNDDFRRMEIITVALFCKQTKNEEFSRFVRVVLRGAPNQRIHYRGKGWPGRTTIEGGRSLPFNNIRLSLMWPSFAFTPSYCFACSDPLGQVADISVGDPWLKKYADGMSGSGGSLFVANTGKGRGIIEELVDRKRIFVEPETASSILASQDIRYICFKTRNLIARAVSFCGFAGKLEVPSSYRRTVRWVKMNKTMVEYLFRTRIAVYVPEFLLKAYGRASRLIFRRIAYAEEKSGKTP